MEELIEFHADGIDFECPNSDAVRAWLVDVATLHGREIMVLNYVFMSDEGLLEVNRSALDHDYYTDIITFPLGPDPYHLISDIYISVDRVRENAASLGHSFENELYRVMVHGLLHMSGFNDKTDAEALEMRKAEDFALSLLLNS